MARPEISRETIDAKLEFISNQDSFFVLERRRLESIESSLFTDNRFILVGSISESNGDGRVSDGHKNAITTAKLRGSEAVLGRGTHIRYENFTLPVDMSEKGLESFYYHREQARIAFTQIHLNEPGGMFNPIKREFTGYLQTREKGKAIAVDALQRFLNNPEEELEDTEGYQEQLDLVRDAMHELHEEAGRNFHTLFEDAYARRAKGNSGSSDELVEE